MYPESSEGLNKETEDAIYFFTTAFHPFDNFSAHQVEIWGKRFPTVEHAFQWKKFSEVRPDIANKIFEAGSPELVKQISLEHKVDAPKNWHERKVGIMEEIIFAKAAQHLDVQALLKKSGNRTIIENSPVDSFWGIGIDSQGINTMGKILMKAREKYI